MYEDLKGKVAMVTGGARGLGLQMATALASQGVDVALLDLLPQVSESATALAAEKGVRSIGLVTDVTSEDSLKSVTDTVVAELGTPSILVNAAGITIWGDSVDVSAAEWRKVLDVNLTGTFLTSQAFARAVFAAEGSGAIVNISSMSAIVVNIPQRQASYNVSKAGVDHLTRSLAVEWIGKGIRVNAISPGYFRSDMTKQFLETNEDLGKYWNSLVPAGRMGEPADLDGLVTFLASDVSKYIVGESVVIDGGYSIV
ncbi:SDR family oxidoreductase [Nakamurella sp. YIM 132087]|uniref:SDR family oxidoreductase n=1 Tax=Nakamurella alba TaxID=2665158 RepID=A0A7K1FIX9_9ACTN|nr:SDR family oxidoreductase [Nakamurella alba]MTD13409.1 SDR family oxidoreductase [Nakamurella alba]